MKVVAVLLVLSCALGCGGVVIISGTICFTTAINVSPQSVTIDHTALPPANSQTFVAFQSNVPSGCPFIHANLQNAVWSVSSTGDANINNSHDQNNINFGRATCFNSASSPITVTASTIRQWQYLLGHRNTDLQIAFKNSQKNLARPQSL